MFSNFLSEGTKVSFDLDDTLQFNGEDGGIPREKYVGAFKDHIKNGDNVIIVTSRKESKEDRLDVSRFLKSNGLPDVPVFYTNGDRKIETLKDENVNIHYDDDNRENNALKGTGIKSVNSFDDDLVKLYSKHWDANVDYDM